MIVGKGDVPGKYIVLWGRGDDEGSFGQVEHTEIIIINDENVSSVASRMKLTL